MISLRKALTCALMSLGITLGAGSIGFAQETTTPQNDSQQRQGPGKMRKHRGPGGKGQGLRRALGQLGLSETQQQQVRAIHERFEASTQTQREELRRLFESNQGGQPSADTQARARALREEIGQAMRSMHEQTIAVLTTEQRAQLEQFLRDRKERHRERRGGRMGLPPKESK